MKKIILSIIILLSFNIKTYSHVDHYSDFNVLEYELFRNDKLIGYHNYEFLRNEKELIVICDVGAYGMSLSSNYNVRPKAIEILIKNSKINVINKRQKLTEII